MRRYRFCQGFWLIVIGVLGIIYMSEKATSCYDLWLIENPFSSAVCYLNISAENIDCFYYDEYDSWAKTVRCQIIETKSRHYWLIKKPSVQRKVFCQIILSDKGEQLQLKNNSHQYLLHRASFGEKFLWLLKRIQYF